MAEKALALWLADAIDHGSYDAQMARNMDRAAAELRRLHARDLEWQQKAKAWLASPEAAQRLEGYRELAQRLNAALKQRDELLTALKAVLPNVATQTVGCQGHRCREAWCWSCFDEKSAEASAQAGCDAYAKANRAIAKAEGV